MQKVTKDNMKKTTQAHMKNQKVKEQFNKQAQRFADWAVTQNSRQM